MAGRSATEGQPAEPLGVRDAGPPALLGRPAPHRLAGPPVPVSELGPVALHGRGLGLHSVGDVNPLVGLERGRQEHGGHLVRRAGVGKVVRERRGRGHGVEQRSTGDPVVAVVEVVPTEEDRGGVMTADDIGTQRTHTLDESVPEIVANQ